MPKRIKVEVFSSPGCNRCQTARAELQAIVAQLGHDRIEWREVDVVKELDYAVRLGVLSTPAIAIDGKLTFRALPSAKKLRRVLEQTLGPSE
ncbi:MAG TPA: thioredoxin family protein [Burkholderiales bacterium]|nr:thioredoxin family protein [Burkholderiales bacterium]